MFENLLEKLTGAVVDSCSDSRIAEALRVYDEPFEVVEQADFIQELHQFERVVRESEELRGEILLSILELYGNPALCRAAQRSTMAAMKLLKNEKIQCD